MRRKTMAIAAVCGSLSCAPMLEPPRGPISAYPMDNSAEPHRVNVGDDVNVVFRANVYINDGKVQKQIVDYLKDHNLVGLTFCWFVYQDIGLRDETGPIFFLMNPRFDQPGQPRYVGAVKSYQIVGKDEPFDVVVPVEMDDVQTYEPRWRIAGFPKGREEALFYLQSGTFVPQLDRDLWTKLGNVCKETSIPEIAVPEYGPTFASLVVYPERQ